jgi:hypothetical protein
MNPETNPLRKSIGMLPALAAMIALASPASADLLALYRFEDG